ncbi:DUF6924 domain-containing protein [Nocardia carnea]|uniref:DUF6924 domain-containing protein n=1 Tax=Nocardia carnea TaxID=37328 RepID=UPI0024538BD0|nr:hypothetical protein [Nocardia carnea]
MTDPEHPLPAVDTGGDGEPVFRIASVAMAEVEVNFLLGSMDFEDYADGVDDDGVSAVSIGERGRRAVQRWLAVRDSFSATSR